LVLWFAKRAGFIVFDEKLKSSLTKLGIAAFAFFLFLLIARRAVTHLLSSLPRFQIESELVVLTLLGGAFYGAFVVGLFGRRWLSLTRARAHSAPGATLDEFEGTSAPPAGPDEI
jgi:hypothetical protein